MPVVIDINANIGSGKSTLLQYLRDLPADDPMFSGLRVGFLPEPVSEWMKIKDTDGTTVLARYYENQEKWAFSFQMMAFITRMSVFRRYLKENKFDVLVTERSMMTDYRIFASMLHDEGKINEIDFQIYRRWFDEFNDELNELCDMRYVYLRCDPGVSHARILHRAREGEDIPLAYLERCHAYHEAWLGPGGDTPCHATIDCSVNVFEHPDAQAQWAQEICALMKS